MLETGVGATAGTPGPRRRRPLPGRHRGRQKQAIAGDDGCRVPAPADRGLPPDVGGVVPPQRRLPSRHAGVEGAAPLWPLGRGRLRCSYHRRRRHQARDQEGHRSEPAARRNCDSACAIMAPSRAALHLRSRLLIRVRLGRRGVGHRRAHSAGRLSTRLKAQGRGLRDHNRSRMAEADARFPCYYIQPYGCISTAVGRRPGPVVRGVGRCHAARHPGARDGRRRVRQRAGRAIRDVVCSRAEARGRAGTCSAGDQAEGRSRAARGRQPRRRAPCQSSAGAVRAALASARRSPGRVVGHFIPRRSACRSSRFARTPKR